MSIELEISSNHLILCHPVSSCPQTFPASGSFPKNWLFASGGQSIKASASASVLPMNIQGWFPFGLTCCPRDSQESSLAPQFESINSSVLSLLYGPTLTSIHDSEKSKAITVPTKICLVKAMVFPVVMYGCESLTIKKAAAAAATAKLLQSCPTLCDPIDGSPPGSSSQRKLSTD